MLMEDYQISVVLILENMEEFEGWVKDQLGRCRQKSIGHHITTRDAIEAVEKALVCVEIDGAYIKIAEEDGTVSTLRA